MVNLKEAFQNVKKTLGEILSDELVDIRLEEFNLSNNNKNWEFIISYLYPDKNPPRGGLAESMAKIAYGREYERLYKKVIVSKDKGQIISIKMYKNE